MRTLLCLCYLPHLNAVHGWQQFLTLSSCTAMASGHRPHPLTLLSNYCCSLPCYLAGFAASSSQLPCHLHQIFSLSWLHLCVFIGLQFCPLRHFYSVQYQQLRQSEIMTQEDYSIFRPRPWAQVLRLVTSTAPLFVCCLLALVRVSIMVTVVWNG